MEIKARKSAWPAFYLRDRVHCREKAYRYEKWRRPKVTISHVWLAYLKGENSSVEGIVDAVRHVISVSGRKYIDIAEVSKNGKNAVRFGH